MSESEQRFWDELVRRDLYNEAQLGIASRKILRLVDQELKALRKECDARRKFCDAIMDPNELTPITRLYEAMMKELDANA